jgi:hypothetical protein
MSTAKPFIRIHQPWGIDYQTGKKTNKQRGVPIYRSPISPPCHADEERGSRQGIAPARNPPRRNVAAVRPLQNPQRASGENYLIIHACSIEFCSLKKEQGEKRICKK